MLCQNQFVTVDARLHGVAAAEAVGEHKLGGLVLDHAAYRAAQRTRAVFLVVAALGEKIDDLMEFDAQTFVESLLPESALQKEEQKEEGEGEA